MHNHILSGYISEQDAIEILTKLTKTKITDADIKACAEKGVIPAYIQFMPDNKDLYNGNAFHLVYDDKIEYSKLENLTTLDPGCEEDFWKALPFPLPQDHVIKATDGINYRVFAARNDGKLAPITDEHYTRIYTDEEVRKCAKNIRRYLLTGEVLQTSHTLQQTWLTQRQSDDDVTVWVQSPFANNENNQNSKLKDNRERTSLHLIIAALASKAGYDLEDLAEASVKLRNDLNAIGLWDSLTGKGPEGPAQKHFEAVKQTVKRERGISDDLLNRK